MVDTAGGAHHRMLLNRLRSTLNVLSRSVTRRLDLRWCRRLADLDRAKFDEAVLQMARLERNAAEPEGSHCAAEPSQELRLRAAISELSQRQRTLLYLFRQGATFRHIAKALGMHDAQALQELTILLCHLARHALTDSITGPSGIDAEERGGC